MRTAAAKNTIAVAILACVAIALGVIYSSGQQLGAGSQGPTKIGRGADGTLWVVSHGALHQFSADGMRRQTVSFHELGLARVVSAVLPLSDGTVVLAQAEPSTAYRCDLAARRCSILTSKVAAAVGATRHALMIAADEAARRFVISDNAGHRLILLDFDGNVLDVTNTQRVLYPNELRVENPGEVTVADTNHHRLVRIPLGGDRFGKDSWEMPTARNELHRPGRVWPMGFAHLANGDWWVLNARNGMKDADLLVFANDGKARRRVDLGADADPTGIAALGDGVLLADPTRAELTRVGQQGRITRAWGDAGFNGELAELRATRAKWVALRTVAQVAIVALPLLGIVLLWSLGERPAARGAAMPFPSQPPLAAAGGGIHWIAVDEEFVRRMRRTMNRFAGIGLVIALAAVYLFVESSAAVAAPKHTWVVLALGAVPLVLVTLLLLLRAPRAWCRRIGADGERFFFDPGNGKAESWPFSSLSSDGRQLLAGRRLIALVAPAGRLFPEEEVQRHVLARVPPAGRVTPGRLLARALEQGNRELWIAVIGCAAILAVALLHALAPSFGTHLLQILRRF